MARASAQSSTSTAERRRSPRHDTVNRIDYKVLIPMEGNGFTQNISGGGFALFLDKEVPPGSVLELTFSEGMDTAELERSIVKVIWCKDHMAGVKLLGR
jgi:hypothetical protein